MIFKDLVVVELASVLAGPAVGMFFAELGARVVKIENKTTNGDVTRQWKAPTEPPDAEVSAYWCSVNWGKEVQLLDLRTLHDRDILTELLSRADIVLSNFRAPAARKLGLHYEQLRDLYPRLIYAQLTGFGEESDRPAFDVVLQAEAGFLYLNAHPEGEPVRMPVALIDLLAAHQLKAGILVALLDRSRTGRGGYLHVSLLQAAVASLANQASNWLTAGFLPQPIGMRHPNIAPYGDMLTTSDGERLVLAVGNDRQFSKLCEVLGLGRIIEDARYATNAARTAHRDGLMHILTQKATAWTGDVLYRALLQADVPVGKVRDMRGVFEQAAARDMVLTDQPAPGYIGKRARTVAFDWQPNDD